MADRSISVDLLYGQSSGSSCAYHFTKSLAFPTFLRRLKANPLDYCLYLWRMKYILLVAYCLLFIACGEKAQVVEHPILYAVKERTLYGCINGAGDWVIPPHYSYIARFSEGMGAINIGGSAQGRDLPANGKWGFINDKNTIIINPKYLSPPVRHAQVYDLHQLSLASFEGYVFSEGLAAVYNGKEWIYINQRDSVVISGLDIQSPRNFSEGLAAVYINRKWGYIDRNGNIAIAPRFLFPANFHEGHAYVMEEDFNAYCIDRTGKRVYEQYRMASTFHNGYAPVKGGFRGEKFDISENQKMGLIDSTGYLTVPTEFDMVRNFGSGLAPALVGSEPKAVLSLKDDYQTIKTSGGKWGFIDTKGRFIINPRFEDAHGFNHGYAAVKSGGLWGYIDVSGAWIYEPQFPWAGDFSKHGAAKVMLGEAHRPYQGKHAMINASKIIWTEP